MSYEQSDNRQLAARFFSENKLMQQENTYNNADRHRRQLKDLEIRRMADRFNVSTDDVSARLEMIEMQKEMTRACLKNANALKN